MSEFLCPACGVLVSTVEMTPAEVAAFCSRSGAACDGELSAEPGDELGESGS